MEDPQNKLHSHSSKKSPQIIFCYAGTQICVCRITDETMSSATFWSRGEMAPFSAGAKLPACQFKELVLRFS